MLIQVIKNLVPYAKGLKNFIVNPKFVLPQGSSEDLQNLSKISWNDKDIACILQSMSQCKTKLIVKQLEEIGCIDFDLVNAKTPLENLKILEVGCGAGYLSEELAKLGAQVTGVENSQKILQNAKKHSSSINNVEISNKLTYVHKSIEDYAKEHNEQFDIVVVSNVMEQIDDDRASLMKSSIDCLKPNGFAFVTIVNRSFLSGIYYIYFCEQMFKIFPKHFNDFSKFMTPFELNALLRRNNCISTNVKGFTINPISRRWISLPLNNLHLSYVSLKQFPFY